MKEYGVTMFQMEEDSNSFLMEKNMKAILKMVLNPTEMDLILGNIILIFIVMLEDS